MIHNKNKHSDPEITSKEFILAVALFFREASISIGRVPLISTDTS
jgi:hypothetical protein